MSTVILAAYRPMDKYLKYLPELESIAGRSKDPSTKVGAMALDMFMNVISSGYNGFPRGVNDDPARYADRELKYKLICHAEQNLVAQAAASGHSLRGSTVMISSLYPCSNCAKSLIQAGIVRIISPPPDTNPRWKEESEISQLMFGECGIELFYIYNGRIMEPAEYLLTRREPEA